MAETQPAGRSLSAQEKADMLANAASVNVGSAVLYATISASGKLAHGVGAFSAQRFGTGSYEVIFIIDVSKGAYVATAACPDPPIACVGSAIIVSVSPRLVNANGVYIATFDATGQPKDSGFNLIVAVD